MEEYNIESIRAAIKNIIEEYPLEDRTPEIKQILEQLYKKEHELLLKEDHNIM